MERKDYPLVKEFITDSSGNICKIILDFKDYQKIVDVLEDQALYQAMLETESEQPLSLETALEELEKDES